MKQLVQDLKTGELSVIEAPPPALNSKGVLVHNLFSVVSAGTERATVEVGQRSLLRQALARPDLAKQVWDRVKHEGFSSTLSKVKAQLESYRALGYSSAGVVLEGGLETEGYAPGDLVACAGGGYANHAEIVSVPQNLCAKVPPGLLPEAAAFATLGAIALQGIRQAELCLGGTVAIIGLGLVGQLSIQLVKAAGCRVIGIDLRPQSVERALAAGADRATLRHDPNLKGWVAELSGGRGVDAAIICASTKSNDPVELAAELLRDRGRVVVVGDVGMEISRAIWYEKELELRLSRSYGPGRYDPAYEEKGADYPIGYVRWTEKRNMEAFLQLLAEGKISSEKLITHRFPIECAAEAYNVLLGGKDEYSIGILLEYPPASATQTYAKVVAVAGPATAENSPRLTSCKDRVQLGVIGAGSFAQAYLLPALKAHPNVVLRGLVTATSAKARTVAGKFGFAYCSGDHRDLLADAAIDAVVIATRHDLHGPLTAEALRAGKAVFVEKPLVLDESELKEVISAYQESKSAGGRDPALMVGFNRRFAELVEQIRCAWGAKVGPWVLQYRVNAGPLPRRHWLRDPEQGGGRLLGEVCHFIDFLQFLVAAPPVRVFAEMVSSSSLGPEEDNLIVSIKFADGSIGGITYCAVGDPSFPKERVEYFGDGKAAVIDDFREGLFTAKNKTKKIHRRIQDKGHRREMDAFVNALLRGEPFPISFNEIVSTTLATLKAAESLKTGTPLDV